MKKDIEVVYLKEALKTIETLINSGVSMDTLRQVTEILNKVDGVKAVLTDDNTNRRSKHEKN
jgi:hypothetical protein